MKLLRKFRDWIRLMVLSLRKQSLTTHASFRVSDLAESLSFYKKLGFRQVTSTRSAEVILLRNHRGDELNLVPRSSIPEATATEETSSVSIRVGSVERELADLQSWYPDLEITEDSVSRQIRLLDPDSHTIELFEVVEPGQRSSKNVYHIATRSELIAGLNDHYYLPPDGENRFVHARARSTFMALACKRVARESSSNPLVIEMDQTKLSIMEEWFDEAEIDARGPHQLSTYPHVHSPVSRQAIVAVGKCEEIDGDFSWPERFTSLNSIVASEIRSD